MPQVRCAAIAPRIQIGALVKIVTTASLPRSGWITAITMPMPAGRGREWRARAHRTESGGRDRDRRLPAAGCASAAASPICPAIGDPVLFADRHDLTRVYAPPSLATIQVGTLFQDSAVPARLLVDDLLSKHFVVVGSTGAGKSCALTTVLQRVLDDHAHAHIVVMDMHNEYSLPSATRSKRINLNNFNLPFWLLNFQELVAALTSRRRGPRGRSRNPRRSGGFAKRRYSRRRGSARRSHAQGRPTTPS